MEDKDIFETQWEQELPPENEMKQIRRTIRKRNWKIICISVILAAALVWSCVNIFIPAVEKAYWDPFDCTVQESVRDLELVLSAYTELFQPGWEVSTVSTGKTGFASYELNIVRYDLARNEFSYMTGTLIKDQLGWDSRFISQGVAINHFDRATYPFYAMFDDQKKAVVEKLKALPEYVTVEAAMSFSSDLDMDQLLLLREEFELPITWVGIRNAPMDVQRTPLCGMDAFSGGRIYFGVNEKYPQFCLDTSANPDFAYAATDLEQHFKSLLQFSSDQLESGRGARVCGGDRNYYAEVLAYVEENGVMTYGCMVFTSPQKLLSLLEDERVSQIMLLDAWIDV
jgi:hypothetical protein